VAGTFLASIDSGAPTDCVKCGKGKYSPNDGATSDSTCQSCMPGTFLETEGNDESGDCLLCEIGKHPQFIHAPFACVCTNVAYIYTVHKRFLFQFHDHTRPTNCGNFRLSNRQLTLLVQILCWVRSFCRLVGSVIFSSRL